MVRKSRVALFSSGALFAALVVTACQASFHAGSGNNPQTAPPPPPPPPPPAATPAPAATTAAPAKADSSTTAPAADPSAKPKDSGGATVKRGRVEVPGNIVFDTGKATLKEGSGSEAVLLQLKEFLDKNPQVTKLRVEGHTDNEGELAANEELSGQRSLTIKTWLVSKGIKAERLVATGFGESRPVADNSTEEGRSQNRRTEFHIAEMYGKRYLGKDPTGGGKVFE